jgi:hypothetical protein
MSRIRIVTEIRAIVSAIPNKNPLHASSAIQQLRTLPGASEALCFTSACQYIVYSHTRTCISPPLPIRVHSRFHQTSACVRTVHIPSYSLASQPADTRALDCYADRFISSAVVPVIDSAAAVNREDACRPATAKTK